MIKPVWNDGAPPHVGWWNTTVFYGGTRLSALGERWGWWNGKGWSMFAWREESPSSAAKAARQLGGNSGSTKHVRWSYYLPKNARVARIDPAREQADA